MKAYEIDKEIETQKSGFLQKDLMFFKMFLPTMIMYMYLQRVCILYLDYVVCIFQTECGQTDKIHWVLLF